YDSGNPTHRDIREFRLQRNKKVVAPLSSLLDTGQYDMLLVPNGAILEFGMAYRVAKLRQIPCTTFEFWRNKIIVSNTSPVVAFQLDSAWLQHREAQNGT